MTYNHFWYQIIRSLTGETVMTLYIGVDFHPHQQPVAMCNTDSGEIEQTTLFHNPELVHRFYEQMPKAVVGIEASCTARWFEQMMNDLGHELRVGNPTLIRARARSRHKFSLNKNSIYIYSLYTTLTQPAN